MDSRWSQFVVELTRLLRTEQIIDDLTRRRAMGVDASFYSLVPKLVLRLDNPEQVRDTLLLCNHFNVAVTFRAAGTSLSGQAISDSVLITLSDNWRSHRILDNGERIQLQPGVIGADANRYLAPYHRKIGPDPASLKACKIGGIAANNASGMCCGVAKNSYHTLDAMDLILADGSELKSDNAESVAAFRESHAGLLAQLKNIAEDIRQDKTLTELINHKYRLKNTTGYAINSFTDFTDPLDMLLHLMIGSEGTLGFISSITLKTVEEHVHKASCLYLFDCAEKACNLVQALSAMPVEAVELMDQRAIDSVKGKPGLPDSFCGNPIQCTALLIETRADDQRTLEEQMARIDDLLNGAGPLQRISMTTDVELNTQLWAIRKATFPAVGAVRDTGTTVIIEDVAFPMDSLAEGVNRLHQLFEQFGYHEAIIFGHALAGNLHFVFTQSFELESEIERYHNFMQAVANLVAVEFKGSLKAEHGTGRNMAPFVELEWGQKAYDIMWQVKRLFDPQHILNPGVILNDDQHAHINDLKHLPEADPIVDKCIECGFCEPVCPSKNLSLTPRQRIAIWRRIQQLRTSKEPLSDQKTRELKELSEQFSYLGVDTCAATGLCAEQCPVDINTGDLVRQLRAQSRGKFGQLIATWSAEHFSAVSKVTSIGMAVSSATTRLLGKKGTDKLGQGIRKIAPGKLPSWHSDWPSSAGNKPENVSVTNEKTVVYFPSCASRTMGPAPFAKDKRNQMQVLESVLSKAGYTLILADNLDALCCGMPFNSKGFPDLANSKGKELFNQLQAVSQNGRFPIVFDTSPCKLQFSQFARTLPVFESCEFVARFALDKLAIQQTEEAIALHITCSSHKMQLAPFLRQIANACSKQVIEPDNIACCGFAGDKGMFTPELNQSALKDLKAQLPANCDQGYSNSRTCEIGLSHHSGIEYRSLFYLLDQVAK